MAPRFLLNPPTFKYLLDTLPLEHVLKYRLVCKALDHAILDHLYGQRNINTRPLEPGVVDRLLRHTLARDPVFEELIRETFDFVYVYTNPIKIDRPFSPDICLDTAVVAAIIYSGRDWAQASPRRPLNWSNINNEHFHIVMTAWLQLTDTVRVWLHTGHSAHVCHPILGNLVYAAAYNDDVALMWMLIHRGVDVMTAEGAFGDAFKLAANRGSTRVVKLFLDTQQYYNAVDANLRGPFACPLSAAAAAGMSRVVSDLLPYRWHWYICNETQERSPLYIAAQEGWVSIVYIFLGCSDIDPNSGRYNADTPLAVAIERNNRAVTTALVNDPRVRIYPHQHLTIQRVLYNGH
ncbi:hypothetical protein ASPCADRAFT_10516 [Aspergillus carbonarius ITEM 5010]|uniref:Uncharacterized protein n=1 Tax=Aspergillus carbonarius (strain ITEM 5010) TaxID=602072 RepID=A0A1R3R800_ASPC5|nr:hypothetical protein ASPCADRAFT_10516 [Aspergillus carbonarius ITEM 5010]